MKNSILILVFLVFLLPCSRAGKPSPKKKSYTLSGCITQTHAYCGGARPSDEMIKRFNTPVPFPGKKIYIRSGKTNSLKKKILREIKADSAGHFSIQLPPGEYCIIQEEQVKKLNLENFRKKANKDLKLNEDCLKTWWEQCFMTLEVKDQDLKDLKINFHFPCFTGGIPCMTYTGPMPP